MQRRIFNSVAAMLLLVCVAALVVWIRGSFMIDKLEYQRVMLSQYEGGLYLGFSDDPMSEKLEFESFEKSPAYEFGVRQFWVFEAFDSLHRFAGFAIGSTDAVGSTLRSVAVPCWFVALVSIIFASTLFRRSLQLRKKEQSLQCSRCGYDLRAVRSPRRSKSGPTNWKPPRDGCRRRGHGYLPEVEFADDTGRRQDLSADHRRHSPIPCGAAGA
jgi:hypothetical protein